MRSARITASWQPAMRTDRSNGGTQETANGCTQSPVGLGRSLVSLSPRTVAGLPRRARRTRCPDRETPTPPQRIAHRRAPPRSPGPRCWQAPLRTPWNSATYSRAASGECPPPNGPVGCGWVRGSRGVASRAAVSRLSSSALPPQPVADADTARSDGSRHACLDVFGGCADAGRKKQERQKLLSLLDRRPWVCQRWAYGAAGRRAGNRGGVESG